MKVYVCFYFIAILLAVGNARGEDTAPSNQPYIDQLKKELNEDGKSNPPSSDDSYIEQQRKKLPPETEGSHIDELKRDNPDEFKKQPGDQGFIDEQRSKLGPGDNRSAIDDVKNNHSELHEKYPGNVRSAFGFHIDVTTNNSVVGDGVKANDNFGSLYGDGWSPDVAFFYEHYFSDLETSAGAFGWQGSFGGGYHSALGKFEYTLTNYKPVPPVAFSTESKTRFQFITLPIQVGVIYRLNALTFVKPFVSAGGTLIPMFESRNDSESGHYGLSKGIVEEAGVSISLDWVSKGARWSFYSDLGVQHYYLTFDVTHVNCIASPVDFENTNFNAGFTFEY